MERMGPQVDEVGVGISREGSRVEHWGRGSLEGSPRGGEPQVGRGINIGRPGPQHGGPMCVCEKQQICQ